MVKLGQVVPIPSSLVGGKQQEKIPFPLRGDVIAALGELVGMTIFIFLALGGVQGALNAPSGDGQKVPTGAGPTYT